MLSYNVENAGSRVSRGLSNHCAEQTLWNTAKRNGDDASSEPEDIKRGEGGPHEKTAQDRLWNKRPDGIAFKMPTKTKSGVNCLMEFNRMSDVTDRYVVMAKCVAEEQYASFRSALSKTMQCPCNVQVISAL